MPQIINPFVGTDPTAEAFAGIGKLFAGPSIDDRLRAEKLRELQRQNTEAELLAKATMGYGDPSFDPREYAARAGLAGDTDYAKRARYLSASLFGADDPRTSDAMVGAGDSYSSTPAGFDKSLAETKRQFDMKPLPALDADGNPVFVPTSGAFGVHVSPILSDAERKGTLAGQNFGKMGDLPGPEKNYLGADGGSSTPKNYIAPDGSVHMTYDGVTDAQTSAPLPPGGYVGTVQGGAADVGLTNTVKSGLQGDLVANEKFNFLADQALDLTKDPTLFGPVGFTRSLAQEIAQGVGGIAALFGQGGDGAIALETARADLQANGIADLLPEIYDSKLPAVQTVWGLLVYSGAAALAGQNGRSVSDRDVQFFKYILGDPQSLFSSAEAMKAKLEIAKQIVAGYSDISKRALGGTPAPAAAAPAPTPAAPAAQPAATPPPAGNTNLAPEKPSPVSGGGQPMQAPSAPPLPDAFWDGSKWVVVRDGQMYEVQIVPDGTP